MHIDHYISGVKHLEEIREAGLETPAVNQLEVCLNPYLPRKDAANNVAFSAASPILSTEANRGILPEAQHSR